MGTLLRTAACIFRRFARAGSLTLVCLLLVLFAASCDRRAAIEHYNRGVTFAEAGQYVSAIGEFQEALRLVEDFPESHNSLGYVYNQLGRYDEAVEHFRKAAEDEEFDQRALAYQNLGAALANAKRYKEAESALQVSVGLDPLPKSQFALAQVYAIQGKSRRALAQLENVLRQDATLAPQVWTDPAFAGYIDDPGFAALRKRYGP